MATAISSEKWAKKVRTFHEYWKFSLILCMALSPVGIILSNKIIMFCTWVVLWTQGAVTLCCQSCPLSELEIGLLGEYGISSQRIKRIFLNMFFCTLIGIAMALGFSFVMTLKVDKPIDLQPPTGVVK